LLDSNGKGYSFSAGGNAPSAPQSGCTPTWNQTTKNALITQNWNAIVARHTAVYSYNNNASFLAVLDELIDATESAISDIGTIISDVAPIIEDVAPVIIAAAA
jgi:hypothetical protein